MFFYLQEFSFLFFSKLISAWSSFCSLEEICVTFDWSFGEPILSRGLSRGFKNMGSLHTPFFLKMRSSQGPYGGEPYNGGFPQQPWGFLLKMTILRCFGGTTIYGNTHIFFNYSRPIPTIWKNWISCPLFISQQNHYTIQGRSFTSQTCAFDSVFHIYMDDWLFVIHKLIISKHMSDYIHLWYIYIYIFIP